MNDKEQVIDTVEIIGDQMCVMDAGGNGLDGVALTSYRKAKRQIQRWAATHTIVVADAYRLLADHFSHRTPQAGN